MRKELIASHNFFGSFGQGVSFTALPSVKVSLVQEPLYRWLFFKRRPRQPPLRSDQSFAIRKLFGSDDSCTTRPRHSLCELYVGQHVVTFS